MYLLLRERALAVLNCLFCTVGGTSSIHAFLLMLLLMFSELDTVGMIGNIHNIAKAYEVQKETKKKVKKNEGEREVKMVKY